MKDIINQISEQVMNVTEELGKQTEKVVESQKLKAQLRKIKMDRNQELEKIGRLYFEMYKNGELTDPKFEEYFVNVKDKEIVIRYLENKLIKYQDKTKCPYCEAVMGADFQYCPQCGKAIEPFDENEMDISDDMFEDEDKNTTADSDEERTTVVRAEAFEDQFEDEEE